MFNVTHMQDLGKDINAWLYKMHQDMFRECGAWKRHTDNVEKMEKLIDALEQGGFTDELHDELYAAIGTHHLNAADVAYFIGLRHGIAAHMAISDGNIKDLLEKANAPQSGAGR